MLPTAGANLHFAYTEGHMAKQGISNRQSPQDEARERSEFPPTDPNKREHIEGIDEPRSRETEDEEEFDESEEDDDVEDDETSEDY